MGFYEVLAAGGLYVLPSPVRRDPHGEYGSGRLCACAVMRLAAAFDGMVGGARDSLSSH
jgi:hypothetical protein